jgi:hypothetical protein
VASSVPWDGSWYAAIGEQFYGPLVAEARAAERQPVGHAVSVERPAILALAALPGPQAVSVLAATTHGPYYLAGRGQEWQPLDAGAAPRPVVAVVPSPDYAREGTIYALEVGGTLWRLRHAAEQPSPEARDGHSEM